MVAILPVIQAGLLSTLFVFGALILVFVATITSMRMCKKSYCLNESTLNAVIEMEIEVKNKKYNVTDPDNAN